MTPPVTFSTDADGVGWIVFDDPGARANVLNAATQAALAASLDAAASSGARALVVVSAKERIFVAGADLRLIMGLAGAVEAQEFSRAGQALLGRFEALGAPVVCAIGGACAGGGLELALACHWRIAGDSPSTQIGLPETGIGVIPGWGGCVRLPRLIGARAALEHILAARLLPAAEALGRGLVDEVAPAGELRARAKAAALRLAQGGPPARPDVPAPAPAFFGELRESVRKKTMGRLPAPLAAIDAVEGTAGIGVAQALVIEARAFGAVASGAVCKNLIHGFFLQESARKRNLDGWFPAAGAAPAPVGRVGIVGAGVMGSGIAQWLAARGHEVVMRDVRPELAERGLAAVRGIFDEAVRHGALTEADARTGLGRVSATAGWDGFESCDLVIEAIVEDVAAKQALFAELSGVVGRTALLASNTSALPIEDVAGGASLSGRALGIHFFNPVGRMPLVELIIGRDTTAEAAARALAFVKAAGKSVVICRSSPGFLVTRVLFFYLGMAVRYWELGVPTAELDGAARAFGWPMGPMRLIDEVGVDVAEFIFGEMEHYFPGRFERPRACAALLAAGLRGRKGGPGSGFYAYGGGAEAPNDPATRALAGRPGPAGVGADEAFSRLMATMVAEARMCLETGVVLSPDDVDYAMLKGAGFPAFRGGLMRHAAAAGMA